MQVSLLITLLACIDRTIPGHLLAAPKVAQQQHQPPVSADALTGWHVGTDPLARSVRAMPQTDATKEVQTYLSFFDARKTIEQDGADAGMLMQIVEERGRGTAVVPFARGYRLRSVETTLSHQSPFHHSQQREKTLATLATPLRPSPSALADVLVTDMRSSQSTNADGKSLLNIMETWVLLGWLDGPSISLADIARLLEQPQYGRFDDNIAVKLIRSRANNNQALPVLGEDSLRRATLLELTRAAADLDSEIADWAEEQNKERAALGGSDPIHHYLTEALDQLSGSAGDDPAMANALVAIAALQWTGSANQHRYSTLHKIDPLSSAKHFDAANPLIDIWRTIALKEAIDTMDVGRNTSLFDEAVLNLIGVLISTGEGPFHVSVLAHNTPSSELWLEIGRGIGAESTADWERLRRDLGYHLRTLAKRARAGTSDPAFTKLLLRIENRA
jgi:hypothetical protein